jgi:diaminopimelate dehydrogenase
MQAHGTQTAESLQRLAIIGYGRLGRACAQALTERQDLQLAGIVELFAASGRAEALVPIVGHVRDLEAAIQVALVCVPATSATGVARQLLQERIAVVECAMLEGHARARHYQAIAEVARHHRTPAVVGAGWDPGVFPLLARTFEILVPKGTTNVSLHPGVRLHHIEALKDVAGVNGALATELRAVDGETEHYVYVELGAGGTLEAVRSALLVDPLYSPGRTQVFQVNDVAALETHGVGVVLERRGTSIRGAHQNLLLEARFDLPLFAARVMLDAASRIPSLAPGVHRYALWA